MIQSTHLLIWSPPPSTATAWVQSHHPPLFWKVIRMIPKIMASLERFKLSFKKSWKLFRGDIVFYKIAMEVT